MKLNNESVSTGRTERAAGVRFSRAAFGSKDRSGDRTAKDCLSAVPCDIKRTLIVDDERAITQLLELIISTELPELELDKAWNGAEAVDSFDHFHHGVVIMDLRMPVMNGKKAFAEIWRICQSRNWEMPAIIFCTAYRPAESFRRAIDDSPRHSLLLKPMDAHTIVDAVKSRSPYYGDKRRF